MSSTIKGSLIFESPVYRGNSKKTIFTRGKSQNDISLPGKIDGSAQAMMDAFTGFWKNQRNPKFNNQGLLEQLWFRLYAEKMPNFIFQVSCRLDQQISNSNSYFDLRMGIAIDRDRMAQAPNQNFRLETVYKGSKFHFSLDFDESKLNAQNKVKFAYLIEEMVHGRFWFGAQKSTGFGKCHLKLDDASRQIIEDYKNQKNQGIQLNDKANYIFIHLNITPDNPLLVSWPWGNKDNSGKRDTWIDKRIADTEAHREILKKIRDKQVRSYDDIEKLPGGKEFKEGHLDNRKKGRRDDNKPKYIDLNQIKRNAPKAVKNDDTLIDFLQGYRKKAHDEIDKEANLDFREEEGKSVRGKPYDQMFYRSLTWDKDSPQWELCIPGNTIKGALRTKAQQILRTLHNGKGCKEKTESHQNKYCDDKYCPVCSLFGRQGGVAKVFCSDAYLISDNKLLANEHFSYDQIAIDPKTGKSLENSKLNYLYAYGQKFAFKSTLVLKDLDLRDLGQLGYLMFLLKELEGGNIPLGGKKTLNFGHVSGKIDKIEFLCPPNSKFKDKLNSWDAEKTGSEQLWQRYKLNDDHIWTNQNFIKDLEQNFAKLIGEITVPEQPYKTKAGHVSHRQYSTLCGYFIYELEAITPLHIKESGEPSFQSDDALGYDFFSLSPPKNAKKQPINQREYTIPPSTIKGAVRNIYNLISQKPCSGCTDIRNLCDTCRLFGWVKADHNGKNNNTEDNGQALMGRLKFGFGRPTEDLNFEWYGVEFGAKGEKSFSIAGNRVIPHTDLSNKGVSRHGTSENPNNLQKNITLNRFAAAGSKFEFKVDFTNLEKDEFNKILWAIGLEDGLGHKIGKSKALGFGSCKVRLKEAYLIDWKDRFSTLTDSGLGYLNLEKLKPFTKKFANYQELKEALSLSE